MTKKTWDSAMYLGMEWELNFSTEDMPKVKAVVEKYLHGRYLWKRDGSLSSGAELVIAPTTLQCFHDLDLKTLCFELQQNGATGYKEDEAGIHFHVSRGAIKNETMRKVMAWFMANRRFVRRFCKRSIEAINHWAKIPYKLNNWYIGEYDDLGGSVERHIAINRTDKTWEFRTFRSTTRYERIKASMHFVPAIISFAAHHSLAVCTSSNGFNAFMEYLQHSDEHQFLLNYIVTEPKLVTVQRQLSLGKVNEPRIYLASDEEPSAFTECDN